MQILNLKQKIARMFILGFEGEDYNVNPYFKELLENNLGGVIFFTQNIISENQFITLINSLKSEAKSPIFLSIDQEGGRVERTENIHNGKKYLSAKYAYEKGEKFLKNQTKEIICELKNFGINMNFAPVLDVNTNENNPIIGERAFSNNPFDVIKGFKTVFEEYEKNSIITVGKHFPGHGAADKDSHKTLPKIDLPYKELKEIHIKPFTEAINEGIPAIMAAHVLYPALENNINTPASLSKMIITDLLRNKLNFKGIIMTDDMEMNGVKGFSRLDACIKAINAGINMFIFRNTTKEIFELINQLSESVQKGIIEESAINQSVNIIENTMLRYGIEK